MRIIDLLKRDAIALNQTCASKQDAIDKLISLHESVGNLADTTTYKNAILARENQGTTAIGQGIAVPHAKSDSVKKAGLSLIISPKGVDYGAPDGNPSTIIFMIAAPINGDLHLEILSRLMTMLMDEELRTALKNAVDADEILSILDNKEQEKYPDTLKLQLNDKPQGYRILAVTACPTGIAHTYMAAEALEQAGEKMGYPLKAETNGSGGAKNILTKKEIDECDGIIIAADKNVEMARFDGKPVLKTSVSNGINKPQELIQKIIDGNAPIYHAEEGANADYSDEGESFARQIYKHLMNGVSHMLPFVVGGGVLIALGFLIDTLLGNSTVNGGANPSFGFTAFAAAVPFWIGKAAFAFMLPILAGFIAQSIADRPGLLPGMLGGVIAANGYTFSSMYQNQSLAGDDSAVSGFLGALFAGFMAGIIINLLKKLFAFLPKAMDGIKPVFLYPLLGAFIVGAIMCLVNPLIGVLNQGVSELLQALGTQSKILLSIILAAMMATDMGGPINKAAYVFGTAAIVNPETTWIMAAVMVGGMVPPIAIALSTTFAKSVWSKEERKNGPVNYLMGLCFITEGAIPYAATDPLRVIPSCAVGSAVAGLLTALFGVTCPAPHGGIFTFAVCTKPLLYIVALVIGSIVGAIVLSVLKMAKKSKQ